MQKPSGLYLELFSKLNAMRVAYQGLYALALEKQNILIGDNDFDALRNVTAREEKTNEEIAALERERMDITTRIEGALNASPGSMSVSTIAAMIGGPDDVKLMTSAKELLDVLVRLKEQNALNRQLIEMKMSYNAYMLDLIRQDQGPSNLYSASGQENQVEREIYRILDSEV